MEIHADTRLFWFLKEGATLDLDKPSQLDLYVRQVITRGGAQDVKMLLAQVSREKLRMSLERMRSLPFEIKRFWEDLFASH